MDRHLEYNQGVPQADHNREAVLDFSEQLNLWPETRVRELIIKATPDDVKRAIHCERLSPRDLAVLLSPQAASTLEDMAQVSNRLTRSHFGRTIGLYAPIYLSNVCNSDCVYCGYAVQSGEEGERRTLVEAEIRAECEALSAYGFQSVLLLTGDTPRVVPIEYLARSVEIAAEYFVSVSVEVYSLTEQEYKELVRVGLDGLPCIWKLTTGKPTPKCICGDARRTSIIGWALLETRGQGRSKKASASEPCWVCTDWRMGRI